MSAPRAVPNRRPAGSRYLWTRHPSVVPRATGGLRGPLPSTARAAERRRRSSRRVIAADSRPPVPLPEARPPAPRLLYASTTAIQTATAMPEERAHSPLRHFPAKNGAAAPPARCGTCASPTTGALTTRPEAPRTGRARHRCRPPRPRWPPAACAWSRPAP
eukprot:scaffold15016_cov107-Isochrysis_galbana.AAC.2